MKYHGPYEHKLCKSYLSLSTESNDCISTPTYHHYVNSFFIYTLTIKHPNILW